MYSITHLDEYIWCDPTIGSKIKKKKKNSLKINNLGHMAQIWTLIVESNWIFSKLYLYIYIYIHIWNCKFLDKTSYKAITISPLEYVTSAGTNSWRDVYLLGFTLEDAPSCITKDRPTWSLLSWEESYAGAFPLSLLSAEEAGVKPIMLFWYHYQISLKFHTMLSIYIYLDCKLHNWS